mmetsp:Transcript_24015/g.27687  ORF Transcript_24015/g.27687 Transcript_24015/m.27687 type:complete len:163 (-) Transcript_24015:1302-1790(-)
MNKNFFRAVKRECKEAYNRFVSANNLRKKKEFLTENVKVFASSLIENATSGVTRGDDFSVTKFQAYIMVLVNFCHMKKLKLGAANKAIMAETQDVLYCYSHTKFHKFLATPEVMALVEIVVGRLGGDSFVRKFTSEHHEEYKAHIAILMSTHMTASGSIPNP